MIVDEYDHDRGGDNNQYDEKNDDGSFTYLYQCFQLCHGPQEPETLCPLSPNDEH